MSEERLTDTIPAFRVNDEISGVIRGIVKKDRRTIADVTRALLERGVAAYKRDGQLFEPEAEDVTAVTPDLSDEEQLRRAGKHRVKVEQGGKAKRERNNKTG